MLADKVLLESYIGGSFHHASEQTEVVSSPTNSSDVIGEAPVGEGSAIDHAMAAARDAQAGWARASASERAEALYRWADSIKAHSQELSNAIVREVGKPVGEAQGEVTRCISILRYYAGEAVREIGELIPSLSGKAIQYSVRMPLGVVGLVTPWNFPAAIPIWKAAPAIALGNAVVLKPSEFSSYVSTLLAKTSREAGLPAGVFNVVLGRGDRIGGALLDHAELNGVSFTGSSKVGKYVAQACAARNIPFQTEMGGKNVAIVLADADIARAASLVAAGAMRFAGQKCTATSRVIVERSIREPFLKALKAAIEALPVGDPADATTAVGPVISQRSRAALESVVCAAEGECFYSGIVPGGKLQNGNFVAPTVFTDVPVDSKLAQDELFGPVLAVFDAMDLEHAISVANGTRYGLSASLFTSDLGSAVQYVHRIEAGMVRVNADTTGVDLHAPFGGTKGSSSHSREQGSAARHFYTELKTVQIEP